MNYIKELNAFRDWSMINRPSTGQVALWYSLMSVNNMVGWKEWFTAPNQTLQLMTGLSRQGLDKARNGLIQLGLIQYKKGRSNKAGSYRMISLIYSECQKVGTGVDTVVGTQRDTQIGTAVAHSLNEKKTKRNKKRKDESSSVLADQVKKIWEHYQSESGGLFPRGQTLTTKRRKKIEERLKDINLDTKEPMFTVDDIKSAITNIRQSPWHCGNNPNGKIYFDIEFICRSPEKIEEWMNYLPTGKVVSFRSRSSKETREEALERKRIEAFDYGTAVNRFVEAGFNPDHDERLLKDWLERGADPRELVDLRRATNG